MRLFIAVPLSEPARSQAARAAEALKKSKADAKWVEPENMHLTLRFLGETAENRLQALRRSLSRTATGANAFSARFKGFGAFSSWHNPRVIHIPCVSGANKLSALAGRLEAKLQAEGFAPPEDATRPFSAHLTLGRMRSRRGVPALKRLADKIPAPDIVLDIGCLVLCRSRLSGAGPSYEELFQACLLESSREPAA